MSGRPAGCVRRKRQARPAPLAAKRAFGLAPFQAATWTSKFVDRKAGAERPLASTHERLQAPIRTMSRPTALRCVKGSTRTFSRCANHRREPAAQAAVSFQFSGASTMTPVFGSIQTR
jgi:hypothetical protein